MKKVLLEIVALTYTASQSKAYALILGEKGTNRRLPIMIGVFEAQSIVIKIENLKSPRPNTHDLFVNFATEFNIVLEEVIINQFSEGIFYSILVCSKDGKKQEIDSRTSDAVALALRFNCPIYTYESIMEKASIFLELSSEEKKSESIPEQSYDLNQDELQALTEEQLKELLTIAVENEEFERASVIRDEIKKREESKKQK